jgi:hypothetical protein|tara:strand:- start:19 stop:204 length:186 start_codon:yes stop_codon:yes gene_type:complete
MSGISEVCGKFFNPKNIVSFWRVDETTIAIETTLNMQLLEFEFEYEADEDQSYLISLLIKE